MLARASAFRLSDIKKPAGRYLGGLEWTLFAPLLMRGPILGGRHFDQFLFRHLQRGSDAPELGGIGVLAVLDVDNLAHGQAAGQRQFLDRISPRFASGLQRIEAGRGNDVVGNGVPCGVGHGNSFG
ncbi:hypothetical protein MPLA_1550062 [Mesorhizobium sp. ORS 3359]|nr:hypothetical protein MPLA_1550062 [Mesorhizobium sp. ORS 3359]